MALTKRRVLLAIPFLLAIALPSAWAAGYLGVPILSFPFPLPRAPSLPQQGITGSITIGNTQPLCRPDAGIVSYLGPNLVVKSTLGTQTTITVNWTLRASCTLVGTFRAQLNPGTYNLTLTSCLQNPYSFGCASGSSPPLPLTVKVLPTSFTPVNIQITTGIY